MSKFKIFMNKYLVTVVMVPSLVGIHWGWYHLHQNEALVPEHQRRDLPIVSAATRFWHSISGGGGEPSQERKEEAK